jgi:hypothetical protein
MDESEILEDFQERVDSLGEELEPILAEEEHIGVCVYALLNALGHELRMMIVDCKKDRSEIMEQLNKDLNGIIDWQLEVHNQSGSIKKSH